MAFRRKKLEAPDGVRYLSAADVAERYGRPLQWVYKCEKLPKRKIGKYLVYREDELEIFEEYRKGQGRGFFIRHSAQATKLQKARKSMRFDIL
jgi:hypothetical protein